MPGAQIFFGLILGGGDDLALLVGRVDPEFGAQVVQRDH